MGNKQSGFLIRHEQDKNDAANALKDIMQQFMIDTLQIAMNRYESFGYKRLVRLSEEWEKVRREFYPAIDPRHPECDVKQEHMDRIFAEICKDHMKPIPFAARYPRLKGVSYRPKKMR